MLLRKKVELLRLRYEKCMKARIFAEPDYLIKENYLKVDSLMRRIENSINLKMKDYKLNLPPLAIINTSASLFSFITYIASAIFSAAPGP